ncbi:hypothetical protein [Streptomyces sp. NBC_01716]|uniref:hypothetical protein n=1 Tax=Streptomyces sp. NBC_01716 TaxID=2975917 RepID=UPI002E3481CD|nr:hypothetical protein [Streptomyces sp. NBC_01716]
MALVPLVYLALAMAWTLLPFLAMRETRFATHLLVGHVAVGAAAWLYAVVFTQLGPAVVFCAGPGTLISLLLVFLKLAFPDRNSESD